VALSIKLTGYSEIVSQCGADFVQQISQFAKYARPAGIAASTAPGSSKQMFDLTLVADLTEIDKDANPDGRELGDFPGYQQFAYEWACIKKTIIGFPLRRALAGLAGAGGEGSDDNVTINYRASEKHPAEKAEFRSDWESTEAVYICPADGKVSVVFSLAFRDTTDDQIAGVFLKEFATAKKDPKLGAAPLVLFDVKPPGELSDCVIKDTNVHKYVNFTLEQRHVRTPEMLETAIDMLYSFRNYIHYHVKCCKGYMHTRMRTRSEDLLQVLHQAEPQEKSKSKSKHTVSHNQFS
jgi:hypothetical protein